MHLYICFSQDQENQMGRNFSLFSIYTVESKFPCFKPQMGHEVHLTEKLKSPQRTEFRVNMAAATKQ